MIPAESAFTDIQYAANYPTRPARHFWHQTREALVLRELTSRQWANELVLDVGCGPGLMVNALRARGVQSIGCDVATIPRAQSEHLMSNTRAQDLPLTLRKQVGVILLLDVLEHLLDPAAELKSIREAFPYAKGLIVTVPARPELWTNYDEYFGHHSRFCRNDLRELLAATRGQILRCGYFFHSLYLPIFAMAFCRAQRGIQMHSRLPQWLHTVMARSFVLESQIMPGAVPGSSLFATVRFK